MRVTSSLFVSALIRRVGQVGASVTVVRHGADEAGAIFLLVDHLDGTVDLYSPAPQSVFTADGDTDRRFVRVSHRAAVDDVEAAIAREIRFDPDVWVIAVEDRAGRPFVEVVEA